MPRDAEGKPAGYVDADVWEAARAFTGWSVAANQAIDAGRRLPDTGEFAFVEAWHDQYQKLFLGRALEPFAGAMVHGRAVLDALAEHPATARFVCTKLNHVQLETRSLTASGRGRRRLAVRLWSERRGTTVSKLDAV